jgi:Fe(3+) dicitrate transport protein
MKTKILLFFSLMIISTHLKAQTGNIKGGVYQNDSVTPVPYCKVYINGTKFISLSNSSGAFYINNVPEGEYVIKTTNSNYLEASKLVKVKANQTTEIKFYLTEKVSVLPEVVVGAGGLSALQNTTGSVSYITEKELETFGYSDVNKTLKVVPGVNLQEEDGFGLRPNIGLRGTGVERSSKITVMEDGILIAPAPYIAPSAYYFPTIGRMQGVEIFKGASQIKYGPYTTGGAINLISTQIPEEFSGKIDLITGSFGSKNLHTYVGNSMDRVGFLIETFQYGADGFKTLPNNGYTGFKKADYLAKLRFNTLKTAKIYQQIEFKVGQTEENSNETYLGLTEEDFVKNPYMRYAGSEMDNMVTKQHQYVATHLIKFSKQLNIVTSVYHTDFNRNWYKLDKVADSSGSKQKIGAILDDPNQLNTYYNIINGNTENISNTLFVKANNRSYFANGIQSNLNYKFKTQNYIHQLEVGVRVHQDQIDRFQWVDDYKMENGVMKLDAKGTPGTESNRVETANALASFIQYKLSYKKLTVTPGLRYENIQMHRQDYGKNDPERTGSNLSERSNYVSIFIPGIGLNYKISKYLVTFLGVHKGFAPPGTKPGTKPEESINYEIGTKYQKNALTFDGVLFYNDYTNLLGVDLQAGGGNGTNDLFNGGKVRTYGVELKAGYDLLSIKQKSKFSLPATIVYTYTDATFLSSFDSDFEGWGTVTEGDKYPYLSNHQATFILGVEHSKFNLYGNLNYKSDMFTQPTQDFDNPKIKIPAYFTVDISANYYVNKQINLFASATNLTNESYVVAKRPAGLRPGMPRAFYLGIKAKF